MKTAGKREQETGKRQQPETATVSCFKVCGCCGNSYYPGEMQRCGLAWYCRYCLNSGLIAGVQHDSETAAPDISDMTDTCFVCRPGKSQKEK